MTVFEPGSSIIASDRAVNCVTTTYHIIARLYTVNFSFSIVVVTIQCIFGIFLIGVIFQEIFIESI